MKRLIRMIILSFFTLAVLVVSSYAWFTNSQFVEPNISGYSVAAYFGGGDGSTSSPFKIKNQRHLYNLAWLQYLGYFNKKGSGIVENPDANTLTHYSFSVENDINMDGWHLPPIGTSYNPFIGSLNGNGHIISNLETTNAFGDLDKHPGVVTEDNFGNKDTEQFHDSNSCSVIGFIGSIGQTTNMNYAGLGITAPTFTNLVLNNNTVSTSTAETLVGSVAGYVNGTISDVGVRIPTLNVNTNAAVTSLSSKTSNLSDFAVVGYAEDTYTTALTKRTTTIYNPTTSYSHFSYNGMGNTTEWGGSIDMRSLYLRTNARINGQRIPSYTSGQINYYDENNELIENKTITVTTTTNNHYGASYGSSGSYLTLEEAPTDDGYDYLTGLYKTVIDIKITGTANGFKIMNYSGNYLNMTSTRASNNSLNFNVSLSPNTDSDSATVWIQKSKSGGGYSIRTYNKDDGYEYYLNATTTTLSISSSDNTTWNLDSNLGYYIENNNKKYYLRYISGNWTISDKLAYYITDNTHYLSRNNGNIINQDDYANATRWIFQYEDTNPYGMIYDESNTNYKLNINGTTLNATTNNTATSWLNNGNNIYSGSNYIIYNNGWKLYQPNQFYIKYNNSYLSLNTNGTINHNITNQNDATLWTFSDISGNPKGYISTIINDTTYYLRLNNGNLEVTTVQNQRTNWSNTGDGLYSTYNNNNYYIQYKNNQWVADRATQKIYGYNLSYDNSTISYNSNTLFMVDENDKVYYMNGNTKTYLNVTRTGTIIRRYSLSTTTNASNGYIITRYEDTLYCEGYDRFAIYNNGNWTIDANNYQQFIWSGVYTDDLENTPVGKTGDAIINFKVYSSLIQPNYTSFSSTAYMYEPTQRPETVPSVFNYIPINTDENYNVKDTNTGYIMAGGHSGASGQFEYPYGSNNYIALEHVDIRTAGQTDSYNIHDKITVSVNDNGTFKPNKVYTYNGSLTTISDSGSTIYASNNQNYKFYKYSASKNSLQQTLTAAPTYSKNGSKYLSGIHFITSQISMNHLITAPSVMINGTTYTNYQMPENSIDFQLKQKGYINFFAGLYYPGSTSFFALYSIKRDSNQKILAINHIKEIYQNTNDLTQDYVYKYEAIDPTTGYIWSSNTNSQPAGYTKIFDTSWIEAPGLQTSDYEKRTTSSGYQNNGRYSTKLFYFEIPVNKGEFALGSVNGRDGGYLLYLDIGANAAAVDRTTITQESKTVVSDYKYVNGIQILADTGNITSISAANSAVAVIKTTSNVSEVSISRTGDTISFGTLNNNVLTPFTNNLDVSYKSEDISLSGAELKALEENETNKKVLKYLDYNRATESLYQTIINNNGTTNTDYEVYRLNPTTMEKTGDILDYNGMDINDRMNATYGLLMIDTTSSSVPAGKRVDNFTSVAITTSTNPAVLKYDLYTDTANKNNVEETIEMVVTRVTGNQTVYNLDNNINDITITNGRLTLSDNYLAEFLYRLQGNTITITSVEETTVTVKEINRANNTYTFIFKTYDGTTYEVTTVGNTVTIPASQ